MPLEDILTEQRPLGPNDQSQIDDVRDAVEVLDLFEPLASAMRRHYTLLYGRKGSGKSAIISLFHGYKHIPRKHRSDLTTIDEVNRSTIYVNIRTWNHFLEMNQSVQRAVSDKTKSASPNDVDYDLVPVETIEEAWIERIWEEVFREFYDLYRQEGISEAAIPNVIMLFDDERLSNQRGTPEYIASVTFKQAKADVLQFLASKKTSVCVLFDSMEKYPVLSPTFGASMSGFLRAINRFQHVNPRTRAVFALPEELLPFFHSSSENILKDFENAYGLRWSAEQLLRMAAHRYRLFLKIADDKFYKEVKEFDLTQRPHLREFYDLIFPIFIENELGERESAVAYVIRHTQLLPRHFIMHLNNIATLSHDQTGGWREFKAEAFREGVQRSEELIAKEVLIPYEFSHRGITNALRSTMAGLPPIFGYGDIHKRIARVRSAFDMEVFDFVNLLYSIGVIGKVQDERTGIYENADFHFNRTPGVALSSSDTLCFHPIFSRFFSCPENRNGDNRIIYPNGVEAHL